MENKPVTINQLAGGVILLVVVVVAYAILLDELGIPIQLRIYYKDFFNIIVMSIITVVLSLIGCRAIDLLMPGWHLWIRCSLAFLATSGLFTAAHKLRSGAFITTDTYLYISPVLVLGVFVYFTYYAGKQWRLRYSDEQGSPVWLRNNPIMNACLESIPEDRASGILEYYRRAQALTEKAESALWVMIVVLTFTAVFMIFAGRISEIGVVTPDHLALMVRERAEIQGKIDRLNRELGNWTQQFSMNLKSLQSTERDERQKKDSDFMERTFEKTLGLMWERLREYDKQISTARTAILTSRPGRGGNSNGLNVTESGTDQQLLIASTVTRLGVAVIAIYLVQILLSLYRYNTRMAADYLAHADTLMMAELDPKTVKGLHSVLLPSVKYGEMPTTFLHRSMDAIERRRRRREGSRKNTDIRSGDT